MAGRGVEIEELLRAGRIAAVVRSEAERLVRPGTRASEICERLEAMIVELGGAPAFPCNFSVNSVAAHYTPGLRDDVVVGEKDVVKVDIGVHIDGHIADTAVTVDLSGEHGKLLEASQRALEDAIATIRPFVSLYEIGRAVENAVKPYRFRVVRNLSGHTIERYVIHAGVSVPNYADRSLYGVRLTPGTVVAIEPFVTYGKGLVREGSTRNIFAALEKRPRIALGPEEERFLVEVIARFKTLPFALRWLRDWGERGEAIVSSLVAKGAVREYPILVEVSDAIVAQFEHTIYIDEDDARVVTA